MAGWPTPFLFAVFTRHWAGQGVAGRGGTWRSVAGRGGAWREVVGRGGAWRSEKLTCQGGESLGFHLGKQPSIAINMKILACSEKFACKYVLLRCCEQVEQVFCQDA